MNLKKIGNIIYWMFVSFLLVLAALMLAPLLPVEGNYKLLTVLSGSMAPALPTGSLVAVLPAADYQVGDIITFLANDRANTTVTHRIVEIQAKNGKTAYIVKGDANNAPDREPVEQSRVIGKVRFNIPWLGYAFNWARSKQGFALLIVFPAALIIAGETKKILTELKAKKN